MQEAPAAPQGAPRRKRVYSSEDVNPNGLYDVDEVRHILGSAEKPLCRDTVYRMNNLPRTKVGAGGGRTRWRGRDILEYLGLPTEG